MSFELLQAMRFGEPYLQSPVDDLWSFYYVAQWAAVFNNANLVTPIPERLKQLRTHLAGSLQERTTATNIITDNRLKPASYGQFLANSCSFLSQWAAKLKILTRDWQESQDDGGDHKLYESFCDYTNRGVLELVQLVQKEFPGCL